MRSLKRFLWIALLLTMISISGTYFFLAYQQQQTLSMIDHYLVQIGQNPHDLTALISLCSLHIDTGELNKALGYCNQALTAAPDAADALQNRAVIYCQQGKLEEALADYQVELQLAEKYSWQTIRTFRYDLIKQAITQIEENWQ